MYAADLALILTECIVNSVTLAKQHGSHCSEELELCILSSETHSQTSLPQAEEFK